MIDLPLIVIIPLIAAPICVMLGSRVVGWWIAMLATIASFGLSLYFLHYVMENGAVSYALGGWAPPVGIEYRLDVFNAFILMIISGIASVSIFYALPSVRKEVENTKQSLFYSIYLLCFAGLLGMTITNDLFNIYVFIEISSLSMYALVAMGRERKSLAAAFEYLTLGTIGATFILIGVGLIYMMTGSLNISDLNVLLQNLQDKTTIKAALAFIILGICLKIAVFPLYIWSINVYTDSPDFVTAFLSGTSAKVGLYLLIKLTYLLFGISFVFSSLPLGTILIIFGIFGVVVGSAGAVFRTNIKSVFAYSSVAQISYIIIAIGLSSHSGITAALLHIFNHAIAKVGIFMCIGAMIYTVGKTNVTDFKGIAKKQPYVFIAFLICAASLVGIPGTAGFTSKWYLVKALIEQEIWLILGVLVVSFFLTVAYVWRIVDIVWLRENSSSVKKVIKANGGLPILLVIPPLILAAANIVFGFYTEYSYSLAVEAASYILGNS